MRGKAPDDVFEILHALHRTDALLRRPGDLLYRLLGLNETIVKILVDTLLFLVSFRIQKELGF